jgi:hypothetical protein
MNFGDRGVSYGNRREGDRIAQDPHQAIKNNHCNAFAYSPSSETPTVVPANRPQTLVAPAPAAERKEQQAKPLDEAPAPVEKPRGGKTASANSMPPPRSEVKAALPAEIVPLPQARPRALPRHRR